MPFIIIVTRRNVTVAALLPTEWVKIASECLETPGLLGFLTVLSGRRICHDARMQKPRGLEDTFRFPGFRPKAAVRGIFGDHKARIRAW